MQVFLNKLKTYESKCTLLMRNVTYGQEEDSDSGESADGNDHDGNGSPIEHHREIQC
jgi:hypothetical protein